MAANGHYSQASQAASSEQIKTYPYAGPLYEPPRVGGPIDSVLSDQIGNPATLTYAAIMANFSVYTNVKNYGAKGDGVTNDTAAINSAIAAMTTGGTLYFPPGNYVIAGGGVPLNKSMVLQGAGNDSVTFTSSLAYPFPLVATGGPIYLRIRGVTFSGGSSAQLRFSVAAVDFVDVSECRFINYGSGHAIENLGARMAIHENTFEGQGNATGAAIYVDYGPHKLDIYNNIFRGGLQGMYILATNGSAKDVSIKNNTVDGQWMYLKQTLGTGSGGAVTYGATTLTDTGAAFGALAVNTTVRALAVKVNRSATGLVGMNVIDTGANFTTAAVLPGDIVRTGTTFGIVDSVVSATRLKVEEWLDNTTFMPTTAPATTAAYTVYGLVLGRTVSNTGTVITVDTWRDWNGTIATPAAGTLYEVAPIGDYMMRVSGASKVNIVGNTVRRCWADQISINACTDLLIASNTVYDGQDVGITVETTGSVIEGAVIANNQISHEGTAGIYIAGYTAPVITGNHIREPNWMSVPASTYGGIMVFNNTTDAEIVGNVIRRANHPNANKAIHLTGTGVSNIRLRNKTVGYGAASDLTITGAGVTNVEGDFQANTIVTLSSATGPRGRFSGDGVPAIPASLGSSYYRRDGGAATSLYVKETSSASTVWAAK